MVSGHRNLAAKKLIVNLNRPERYFFTQCLSGRFRLTVRWFIDIWFGIWIAVRVRHVKVFDWFVPVHVLILQRVGGQFVGVDFAAGSADCLCRLIRQTGRRNSLLSPDDGFFVLILIFHNVFPVGF